MKKISKNLVLGGLLVGSIVSMTSCGNKDVVYGKENRKKVEEAMTLSREDLFKKAADEIQGNEMKFVGTSSRFKKAIPAFREALTKYNAACANMKITEESTVDGQIYTKLIGEIDANVNNGYSAALVQDGYQLSIKALKKNKFINYIPKEWKEASDTNKEVDSSPFALQYNFKTWMYNKGNSDKKIDNVWDYTKDEFKGRLVTMDPNNENVNMDFLVMLTQDKWCDVLKEAYEDATYDAQNKINVEDYAKYGEKKKYAYAFIKGFYTNATFYEDDGKARDVIANKQENPMGGWIVYSKIQTVQKTEKVGIDNITIAALGDNNEDGNNSTMQIKGFGGFMYKHYLQVMPNAPYPYTACAFINFLSTTKEGYKAWAGDVGDYPTMSSININRTKYGHGTVASDGKFTQNDSDPNVYSALNDPSSVWWVDPNKGNAIIEDPDYIGDNYASVYQFIRTLKK